MAWPLIGGLLAGAGFLGGLLQKGPEQINVQYPGPSPIEQEVSKMQLQVARQLAKQAEDPMVKQNIYKLLPETKMSEADRNAYIQEFAQIKQEMGNVALEQSKQAVGQDLDSMVERGVISREQANRQKAQNETAINAMANIWNKKTDAARIAMARGQWMRKSGQKLGIASALAEVDRGAKDLFAQATGAGLSYFNRRNQNVMGLQSALQRANTQMELETSGMRSQFIGGSLLMAGKGYMAKRERDANRKFLEDLLKEQ